MAKEGKYALNWTRLSCHRFVANGCDCLCSFWPVQPMGTFLRRRGLPKAVRHWSLGRHRAGQADQDGSSRLVRHARRLIFRCPRCRFLDGCSRECWIASAGYRRRQAEGVGMPTIRAPAKMRALQAESACLQCAFTPLAGITRPKTTQRWTRSNGSRQETHPLLDRLERPWPCRTRISCRHLGLGCP